MGKRVNIGDAITVRGVEWIVDAIDGDMVYTWRAYLATTIYTTVTLDEIDSCEHEGRLLALIDNLYTLRSEIDTLVSGPEAYSLTRMVTDMINEAKGEQ
jgi:hypothetical protein